MSAGLKLVLEYLIQTPSFFLLKENESKLKSQENLITIMDDSFDTLFKLKSNTNLVFGHYRDYW